MCKWPQSTSDSLTRCAVCGRCCNERGPSDQNGVAGELKRTAPAGNARLFRTGRATGGERNPQLRAVPAGVGRTGVRGPTTEPHREVAARVGATAGEDVGQLRPEALTGQGGTTAEGAVRRKLLGPQGEPAAVWESRSGQECPFDGPSRLSAKITGFARALSGSNGVHGCLTNLHQL